MPIRLDPHLLAVLEFCHCPISCLGQTYRGRYERGAANLRKRAMSEGRIDPTCAISASRRLPASVFKTQASASTGSSPRTRESLGAYWTRGVVGSGLE